MSNSIISESLIKYSFLPEDIIHYILSYSDAIKYRNGKYMNQISRDDKRYRELNRLSPIYQDYIYPDVYYIYICRHITYDMISKETDTKLYVDLENNEIIYTFCYDFEREPENYHLCIRN
jgi:hypothetical protein